MVGGAHTTFIGRGHPAFMRHDQPGENPTLEDHLAEATRLTLAATGVSAAAIDRAVVSNFLGECFASQGHLGAVLAAVEPKLSGKPIARIEAACASGSAAIVACVDALQGSADVALAVGAEVENTVRSRQAVDWMAWAAHVASQRDREFALFPWFFARRARAYKAAFGATHDDLARVVAKAYGNARRNPLALQRHAAVDFERAATASDRNPEFLTDPELRAHIRLLDCTALTDGGSGVVLATQDGLDRLGICSDACTEICGVGFSVAPLTGDSEPAAMVNMARAARQAYGSAGVGPDEVGLAEVHDCFSVAELQMMEALGFAEPGGAPRMLREGETAIDGRLPINPGGGLLGFGHPIGATGIKQVVEVWRQMTGRCPEYPVSTAPRVAVTANLGGDDRTGVVMVHRAA